MLSDIPCQLCQGPRDSMDRLYHASGYGADPVCRTCATPIELARIESIKDSLKGTHTKQPTGWNPREKSFEEYCGRQSYQTDHAILDKVPLTREEKRNIDKIKNR